MQARHFVTTALAVALSGVQSVGDASGQVAGRAWRATEDLRIGGIDGPVALTFVHDLVVTDSLVFVAQGQERRIRVFTRDGERAGSLGQSGQGPGEFRRVDYIGWFDGGLVAMDEAQLRATHLTPDGVVERTQRIPTLRGEPPFVWSGLMYPTAGGRIIIGATTSYRVSSSNRVTAFPVVIAEYDGTVLDTLPPLHHRGWQRVLEGVVFMAPIHWGTRESMSSNGRYYAVADGDEREVVVQIYDALSLSKEVLRVPLPARDVPDAYSDDIARQYHESMGRTALGRLTLSRFKEELDLPERAVGVDLLQVMNDGSVWLSEPSFGADERIWHVVGPGSDARRVVRAPSDVVVMHSEGREVWGRAMDEYLVHYVVRLRLEPFERR